MRKTYQVGTIVRATSTVTNMKKGREYRVTSVVEKFNICGGFTTLEVVEVGKPNDPPGTVFNPHLVCEVVS